jgi:hypothetical protein
MPAPEADIFSPPTEANRISPSSSGAPLKVIFPLIGRRSECGPHPETKASKMSANADKAVKLEENWLGAESIERFSEMLLTHAIAAYRGGLPHFKRRRIYMSTFFSSFAKGFLLRDVPFRAKWLTAISVTQTTLSAESNRLQAYSPYKLR